MKFLFSTFIFTLMIASPLRAETLRLLNWEGYLSERVTALWQQQGHSLEVILFDNDEKRDAILINAKKNRIDVAVVDETVGKLFGQEGRLLKVNESNVPSLAQIDPFWRDRCGKYAVPYLWGTLGIAYRSDVVNLPPNSWRDILEPNDALKGHIGMMDDFTDMLAPALFMKGFSVNTENKAELKQVFNVLKRQAPNVLTYEYPITFLTNSAKADQLYMALVYGGDQSMMNERAGVEGLWKYVVPKEGTLLWVDCLAVSSNTQHKDLAFKFLNFLSQADIAAKNAEDLYVATPNNAAKLLLSEAFRKDGEVFPKDSIIERSQLYQMLTSDNIKLRLRITNAVVNIYESSKAR